MKFAGSSAGPYRRLGTAQLLQAKTFDDNRFQYACDWRDIACDPQAVPLYSNGYDVAWTFDGIVVGSSFPTLFGGVVVGSYADSRDINKPGSYRFSPYVYTWAELVERTGRCNNPDVTFELFEDYGITCEEGERSSWHLTMPDAGHRVDVRATGRRPDEWPRGDISIFDVLDRGEKVGEVEIPSRQIINGNAYSPALRAAERLIYT